MSEGIPQKRRVQEGDVAPDYSVWVANKAGAYFGGGGLLTLALAPGVVAFAGVPFMVIGGVMLKRTIEAYSKTMAVLMSDSKRRGDSAGTQALAQDVVGLCSYVGVKQAYKNFYGNERDESGTLRWQTEFRKLNFSQFTKPLSDEDLRSDYDVISSQRGAPVELKDMQGLAYYGLEVKTESINTQLYHLRDHLKEGFMPAVKAKAERDGEGKFHATIIRPPEIRALSDEQKQNGAYWEWREAKVMEFMRGKKWKKDALLVNFYGAGEMKGTGTEEGKKAYYVVAKSAEVDALRAELDQFLKTSTDNYNAARKEGEPEFKHEPLGKIYLHATVGFVGGDVHKSGNKDLSTVIPLDAKENPPR